MSGQSLYSYTLLVCLSPTEHVWRVARYTCSSLFIGECDNYVDGGVVYKNPSIFAFIFIREFYRMQSTRIGGVVSIGEGKMQSVPLDALSQDNYQSLFLPSVAVSVCMRCWGA